MSAAVLYMSMSVDGFIAGPNVGPENGLGDGGERLHEWVLGSRSDHKQARPSGANGSVYDEFMATGAVVAGRGTVEPAGHWDGDHHDGVPIFVVSRGAGPSFPRVRYVADVSSAFAQAKRAAEGRDVLVHGAGVARLALEAGVLDAIELHIVPVVLGSGRPLFGELGVAPVELERTRVLEGEDGVTHVRYEVRGTGA